MSAKIQTMATYRNSGRSDSEKRYKVSVSGPHSSFQVEFTLNPLNQSSDQRGIKIEIMLDVKEGDTSEMLPVSVQPTDEDGNSGAEPNTAPQTPGSDRPDEAMAEIGSLRSDEGCDWREACATCTRAVRVRPPSPSDCAPGMPEE